MKFNKGSLLNKYNKVVGAWDIGADVYCSDNLCKLFWGSLWNVVLGIVTLLVFYMCTTGSGAGIMELLGYTVVIEDSWWYMWVVGAISLVAIVVMILLACLVIASPIILFQLYKKSPSSTAVEKSVVVQYIKAKKNKWCPRIDWD